MTRGQASQRVTLAALLPVFFITPATAQVGGIANTVLGQLTALVGPAITLGVIWLGVLIMTKRASVLALLIFFVGIAIVASGGLL